MTDSPKTPEQLDRSVDSDDVFSAAAFEAHEELFKRLEGKKESVDEHGQDRQAIRAKPEAKELVSQNDVKEDGVKPDLNERVPKELPRQEDDDFILKLHALKDIHDEALRVLREELEDWEPKDSAKEQKLLEWEANLVRREAEVTKRERRILAIEIALATTEGTHLAAQGKEVDKRPLSSAADDQVPKRQSGSLEKDAHLV